MPNFADDTNVEVLEKETTQAPEETPIVDEAVVEDDAVVEEKPDEEVQAPQPEGTSPAMQELARQWLPEKFIEVARDDEQLKGMIDAAREANAAPPRQEVAEEPEFELKWSDDDDLEVPDAVRKKVTELNDHYKNQIGQLKKDLGVLAGFARDMQQKQDAQAQQLHFEEQRGFDEELDSMDNDIVGKFGSMTDGQNLIREALFKQALALKEKKGGSLRSHVPEVVKLIRAESKQQKQAYAAKIREQSNGRLGSGNSPRLPEPAKPKLQEFREFLDKLGARHTK